MSYSGIEDGALQHLQHIDVSILICKGSCAAAGFSSCCTEGPCQGQPLNCYCDANCHQFGDCCTDVPADCLFTGIYIYIYVITKMCKYWEKLHNTKSQVYCSKHMQLSYHFYTRHLEVGNQQWMHEVILGASVASLPGSAQLSITCLGTKLVLVYIRWVNTVAKAASLLLFSQFSIFTADCLCRTVQMAI